MAVGREGDDWSEEREDQGRDWHCQEACWEGQRVVISGSGTADRLYAPFPASPHPLGSTKNCTSQRAGAAQSRPTEHHGTVG